MPSGSAPQSLAIATKPANNPYSSIPPLPSSASGNSPFAVEQRRYGGAAGGNSAPFAVRNNQAVPRNNQASRKNHKNHKRPNTPRSDIDEQVSLVVSMMTSGLKNPSLQLAMASNGGGRRGTSITHLMNWSIAPRPHSSLDQRIRNYRSYPTWGLGSGYHPVDKARYVNANYRFIVHPNGDYRPQAIDSDVIVPWDMVLQVVASKSRNTNCPICLSHPIAPRMAKCGHIFCLPCLMRYMATPDEENNSMMFSEKRPKSKKCPICWDSVYMNEARPLRWSAGQEAEAPCEGSDLVLRLVMRRHGSTLALPKDGAQLPVNPDEIPWHFAADVADYARIMKGTTDYMVTSFKEELQDLEIMQKEDELMFDDEGEWTKKAVATIYSKIESLLREGKLGSPPSATPPVNEPAPEFEQPIKPEIQFNQSDEGVPEIYRVVHTTKPGQSTPGTLQKLVAQREVPKISQPSVAPTNGSRATEPKHRNLISSTTEGGAYYFYRALPHYYLATLDIRILKATFGSYSSFPSTILPRIENISRHTVDEDFRKRCKYLAHLPSGCEVAFLECDWTDIVPLDTLQTFNSEIEKRRKRKKDKDAREERDKLRAEREEEEENWIQRRREESPVRMNSMLFHDSLLSDEIAVTSAVAESELAPVVDAAEETASLDSSHPATPSLNIIPGQRTVWGTPAVQSPTPPLPVPGPQHDDGWLDKWDLEADEPAHDELDDLVSKVTGERSMGAGKGGGKKKKKKVTLMTNGGRRRA